MRVTAIKWNLQGNCVLLTRSDQSAADFAILSDTVMAGVMTKHAKTTEVPQLKIHISIAHENHSVEILPSRHEKSQGLSLRIHQDRRKWRHLSRITSKRRIIQLLPPLPGTQTTTDSATSDCWPALLLPYAVLGCVFKSFWDTRSNVRSKSPRMRQERSW